MTCGRVRRRNQLLDDLKENRGYRKLQQEALNGSLWRIRFGRGYGPITRHRDFISHCNIVGRKNKFQLKPKEPLSMNQTVSNIPDVV